VLRLIAMVNHILHTAERFWQHKKLKLTLHLFSSPYSSLVLSQRILAALQYLIV
jgi:hypothetical protein